MMLLKLGILSCWCEKREIESFCIYIRYQGRSFSMTVVRLRAVHSISTTTVCEGVVTWKLHT